MRKVIVFLIVVFLVGGWYFFVRDTEKRPQIQLSGDQKSLNVSDNQAPLNDVNVGAISGESCENWNRRIVAVMQPSDVQARPAAGFASADMVFEMPVITASVTRLMGVYQCHDPIEVGSLRSSRHDFLHLAKGLDAIYVSWGGSHFAKEKLNEGFVDNLNCNNDGGKSAGQYCYRKETGKEGITRGVDTGYAKFDQLLRASNDFGYRMENKFSGYKHVADMNREERPKGGHLRVAFAGEFAAEYNYDPESNSFKRVWGDVPDIDRNTKERVAPKNIVVMIAKSEQIEGQYNNVQLGDPWFDEGDSGDAYYYMNGKETRGTWKKDKSRAESKLMFYDASGNEVAFVPGQIWVEVLEPGQSLKWEPLQ